jgi:hypothetical protein
LKKLIGLGDYTFYYLFAGEEYTLLILEPLGSATIDPLILLFVLNGLV